MSGGHGRKNRLATINVTPFVDVMLVLLIVFMVTAPLLTVGVPVDLPRTEAKQMAPETEPLTVTYRANGEVYLQETKIEKSELLARLGAIAREGYDRRIFIRADETAPYGGVAELMATLSAAGYRNLGLVTDPLNAPARPGKAKAKAAPEPGAPN
ncbi:MAG: biopolymer transporter ExbD [Hyphomonadaceae bacterium]|nr:biopolymer transporter ExbD [Hyphomonadaceae bacterium]